MDLVTSLTIVHATSGPSLTLLARHQQKRVWSHNNYTSHIPQSLPNVNETVSICAPTTDTILFSWWKHSPTSRVSFMMESRQKSGIERLEIELEIRKVGEIMFIRVGACENKSCLLCYAIVVKILTHYNFGGIARSVGSFFDVYFFSLST